MGAGAARAGRGGGGDDRAGVSAGTRHRRGAGTAPGRACARWRRHRDARFVPVPSPASPSSFPRFPLRKAGRRTSRTRTRSRRPPRARHAGGRRVSRGKKSPSRNTASASQQAQELAARVRVDPTPIGSSGSTVDAHPTTTLPEPTTRRTGSPERIQRRRRGTRGWDDARVARLGAFEIVGLRPRRRRSPEAGPAGAAATGGAAGYGGNGGQVMEARGRGDRARSSSRRLRARRGEGIDDIARRARERARTRARAHGDAARLRRRREGEHPAEVRRERAHRGERARLAETRTLRSSVEPRESFAASVRESVFSRTFESESPRARRARGPSCTSAAESRRRTRLVTGYSAVREPADRARRCRRLGAAGSDAAGSAPRDGRGREHERLRERRAKRRRARVSSDTNEGHSSRLAGSRRTTTAPRRAAARARAARPRRDSRWIRRRNTARRSARQLRAANASRPGAVSLGSHSREGARVVRARRIGRLRARGHAQRGDERDTKR